MEGIVGLARWKSRGYGEVMCCAALDEIWVETWVFKLYVHGGNEIFQG